MKKLGLGKVLRAVKSACLAYTTSYIFPTTDKRNVQLRAPASACHEVFFNRDTHCTAGVRVIEVSIRASHSSRGSGSARISVSITINSKRYEKSLQYLYSSNNENSSAAIIRVPLSSLSKQRHVPQIPPPNPPFRPTRSRLRVLQLRSV